MSKTAILIHGLVDLRHVPMNLIYGLIDPRTRLIRYIGQSSVGTQRPKQHTKADSGTYCHNWIKALQRLKLTYEIVILDTLNDESELDEAECWWIAFGSACRWPLTNLTEGGVPSAETLAERAERQKRKAERAQRAEAARRQKDEKRKRAKVEYEAASAARIRNTYSPAQLAAIDQRKKARRQARRSPAEIEQRCFQLFEKHAGTRRMFIDVVIGARVTPEIARWLYEKWLTSGKRGALDVTKDHEELGQRLTIECLRCKF